MGQEIQTPGRFRVLAGPGSPYSHKVRAVLRYRRIPHDWVVPQGGFDGTQQQGWFGDLGKRLLPVVQYPDETAWNDSTPIMEEVEDLYPAVRSLRPPSAAERFLDRLIEDFADEWLCLILMAFRWTSDEDVAFCARRQMHGWLGAVSEAELEAAIGRFTARQQMVRNLIGSSGPGRAAFEADFAELLEILERGLGRQLFLFGGRPGFGDFGLYGMFSQFVIDPTPARLIRERAVRLFQWTQYADDLSGHEGDWSTERAPGETVQALVRLAAKGFLPMMQATAAANAAGERMCSYEVRGVTINSVARPYTANCWRWLQGMLAHTPDADRAVLKPLLEETGFWDALHSDIGEIDRAPPLRKA